MPAEKISLKNAKENKNKRKIFTLCLVHKHPKILLGFKKRGFGEGMWNGFGGKIKEKETIEKAVKREVYEEAGINVLNINKLGILEFEFKGNPEILDVHIFRSDNFDGRPKESEEMKPKWFHIDKIPFHKMWPDDKHWFPLFLEGKKFRGKFLFDKSKPVNILDYNLSAVKQLEGK